MSEQVKIRTVARSFSMLCLSAMQNATHAGCDERSRGNDADSVGNGSQHSRSGRRSPHRTPPRGNILLLLKNYNEHLNRDISTEAAKVCRVTLALNFGINECTLGGLLTPTKFGRRF